MRRAPLLRLEANPAGLGVGGRRGPAERSGCCTRWLEERGANLALLRFEIKPLGRGGYFFWRDERTQLRRPVQLDVGVKSRGLDLCAIWPCDLPRERCRRCWVKTKKSKREDPRGVHNVGGPVGIISYTKPPTFEWRRENTFPRTETRLGRGSQGSATMQIFGKTLTVRRLDI